MRGSTLVSFVADVFRSITMNFTDPHTVGEMMEIELEKRHAEAMKAPKALSTMADALPALGIVAAVLGVVKAMGSISEPPTVLGHMIAAALVGTLLGVFLSYGLVGPLAARMKGVLDEDALMLGMIRQIIVAHLGGLAPQLSVEVGRQSCRAVQPTFEGPSSIVTDAAKSLRAGSADAPHAVTGRRRRHAGAGARRPGLGQANLSPRAFSGAPEIVRPGPAQLPMRVAVTYSQQADGSKMSFALGHLPDPDIRDVPNGVELTFESSGLSITDYHKLREITGFETRNDGERTLIVLHFSCNCQAHASRSGEIFVVNVVAAATNPPAKSPSANGATAKFDAEQLRQTLTANLAALNAASPARPAVPARPGAGASPAGNQPSGDLAPAAPAAPRPACLPAYDMAQWMGNDSFTPTLLALRHQAAATHEAPAVMAALAEFYLANRLAGEAQDLAREGLAGDTSDADRTRLLRDADIAQMLRHAPIDVSSVLLANPPECDRPDVPLWRALNAAAAHDTQGVIRDAKAAGAALGHVPDELLRAFAFSIADASGEDAETLRDMAAALRNVDVKTPKDEAERYLLQARLSRASGDTSDEAGFLERAARYGRTVPGLIAKVRLAELASTGDGAGGSQAEALLSDTARVYRDDTLGQDAATYLAERRLRQANYAGALAIAEETAGRNGPNDKDSRGERWRPVSCGF